MRLVSRKGSRALESYIIDRLGIPADILAERAGIALANACLAKWRSAGTRNSVVDVFAGKGMNGADALVSARELFSAGVPVRIWLAGSDLIPDEERWQLKACRKLGIDVFDSLDFTGNGSSIVIDGLFGTAFDPVRGISAEIGRIIEEINKCGDTGGHIIAADIPSGVDCSSGIVSGPAVRADETVTFLVPKTGLFTYPGRKYSGNIRTDRLGIPLQVIEEFLDNSTMDEYGTEAILSENAAMMLPKRIADGHKGTFGKVAVIGGSEGMAGSVCLCAEACYGSGAGLVCLVVPDCIRKDCLEVVPEALSSTSVYDIPFEPDVMVVGPGGANTSGFADTVFAAIKSACSIIVDAQALNVIAADPRKAKEFLLARTAKGYEHAIITPHPGELKRLLPCWDDIDRIRAARDAAREFNCICVLKGAGTVISEPNGKVMINTTGNSSMAKGGSGDILAGIIGALSAQGKTGTEAAALGVFLHGSCGDLAAEDKGEFCARPVDILDKLPEAFRIISKERSSYESTFKSMG